MATIPEIICLTVTHLSVTGQDQTKTQDHNTLEESVGKPSPEDACTEAAVFHSKSIKARIFYECSLRMLPIEQSVPLDRKSSKVHII